MEHLKRFALFFILLVSSPCLADPFPMPAPWFQATQFFFSPLQVRMWGPDTYADPYPWTGLYVRGGDIYSHDPYPSPEIQSGVVYTMDLTPFGVGSDATIAFLSGLLLVTKNGTTALGEERVTFARHGDPINCAKYLGQVVAYSGASDNMRSNFSTFVPLKDGKFDWCIIKNSDGNTVPLISNGINMTLEMWGR